MTRTVDPKRQLVIEEEEETDLESTFGAGRGRNDMSIEDRTLNLLYPLDEFYASNHTPAPRVELIEADSVPQPYRRLLVHDQDMTPTLEAFVGRTIHLRLLQVRKTSEALRRVVLLEVDGLNRAIEFGAIHIFLSPFEGEARREILEGRRPLGAILHRRSLPHSSRPEAYFSIEPDDLIREAFGLTHSPTLYGRHNRLQDDFGRELAEVVEILPPLEEPFDG